LDRSCAHHGTVVHGHKQNHELGDVTDVGPVVVVGLRERQVDQVVEKEEDGNGEDNEGGEVVLVVARKVETDTHPVEDCHNEICPFKASRFQLIFELAEVLLLCTLKCNGHDDGYKKSGNCGNGA